MPVIKELDRTVLVASGPSKVVVNGGVHSIVSVQSIARLNVAPHVTALEATRAREVVNSAKIIISQTQQSFDTLLTHNDINGRDALEAHPASAISGLTYVHYQLIPEATWVIVHNLNRNPSVTVMDSAESLVYGDVQYNSSNQLTISFSSAFSGTAYMV